MPRISPAPLDRLVDWDRRCTRALHRAGGRPWALATLCCASRLGDGALWYWAIAAFALLGGARGLACAAHMLAAGLLGVVVVRLAKQCAARPRPYECLGDVCRVGRALDEFSFPSGHVLHAVSFTGVVAAFYPLIALALVPVALLIALSRIALGLHYPSDVLAGAALGGALALLVMSLLSL